MDDNRPSLIAPWFREMIWGRPRGGIKLGEIWFRAHPLLLKFIFSDQKLSVQVHPGDEYALPREKSLGKTECWLILDAEPGARLAAGLRRPMTGQQILAAVADGSIEQELNWIEVHRGDFIFLPWGTVHALGAGISLCEVQEFSDLTYRMYDYGRGRALHLEKALDVIRTHPSAGKLEPVRMEAGQRCHDLLVACRHFVVERIASAGEWQDTVESPGSQVLIFLAGEGEVMTGGEPYSYAPEQAWRMPEGTGSYRIVPRSESSWLRIHVPVSLDAVRARLVTAGIAERERNRVIVEDV